MNDFNLGNSLDQNTISDDWLNAFDTKVKEQDENYQRNFSGAVWERIYALMLLRQNMAIFKEFIDKLVKWHGSTLNWGKKYYRGKSIIQGIL